MRKRVRRKLECGPMLTVASQTLFASVLAPLVGSWFGMPSHDSLAAYRITLSVAGWFATAGWILQRRDAGHWPFQSPYVKYFVYDRIEPVLKASAPFVLAALAMYCLIFLATQL